MNAYHFGNYLVTLFHVVSVVNVVEFWGNYPKIANLNMFLSSNLFEFQNRNCAQNFAYFSQEGHTDVLI